MSLRVFLLLVLACGLWLGWRVSRARQQRVAVEAIKRYGGFVHYDWEFVGDRLTPGRTPAGPRWLRRLIGDEFFQDVAEVNLVESPSAGGRTETSRSDDGVMGYLEGMDRLRSLTIREGQASEAGLRHIGRLAGLERLTIHRSAIGDSGLAYLAGLKDLKALSVPYSNVTDSGLAHLAGMTRLERLGLQYNRITDRGLEHVAKLKALKELYLGSCPITDAGLLRLESLSRLQTLDIQYCRVTKPGLERLRSLPSLKSVWVVAVEKGGLSFVVWRLPAATPTPWASP